MEVEGGTESPVLTADKLRGNGLEMPADWSRGAWGQVPGRNRATRTERAQSRPFNTAGVRRRGDGRLPLVIVDPRQELSDLKKHTRSLP